MFLIYSQERPEGLPPEEIDSVRSRHNAVLADAQQEGVLLAVERLATTVRNHNGQPLTLDGPFAETKEQLAGFYLLECRDLDEAIEWARRIPANCKGAEGCIEIRPVDDPPPRP